MNTRPQLRILGRQTRIQPSFDYGASRLEIQRVTVTHELQRAFKVCAKVENRFLVGELHMLHMNLQFCWVADPIPVLKETGRGGHNQHHTEE